MAATGTGKNRVSAERAAQNRLISLVREAADLQEIQYPSRPMDVDACAMEVPQYARVSCGSALELADVKTCFVRFEASACVAVDPFELTGVAWKMMEKGRDKMCEAVGRAQKTSAPRIQKSCLSLCLEETLVQCP